MMEMERRKEVRMPTTMLQKAPKKKLQKNMNARLVVRFVNIPFQLHVLRKC
jgi:hypothetical protein